MKTLLLQCCLLLLGSLLMKAQNTNIVVPSAPVSTEELFRYKQTFYYENEVYIVDGMKVRGTPFLIHDWSPGIIIGITGKIYTDYLLKYNAFNQTVLFQQGNDSLEVTNLIKEFTLSPKKGDSTENIRFINANEFRKEKTTFYYEVLVEGETGIFLRYDRKFVNDADKSLPALEGQKLFDIEYSYYYFDKIHQKITRIKASGANIESLVGKEVLAKSGLSLKEYNFSSEDDVKRFFRDFFSTQKKKAF
jgi:hypothetical protein